MPDSAGERTAITLARKVLVDLTTDTKMTTWSGNCTNNSDKRIDGTSRKSQAATTQRTRTVQRAQPAKRVKQAQKVQGLPAETGASGHPVLSECHSAWLQKWARVVLNRGPVLHVMEAIRHAAWHAPHHFLDNLEDIFSTVDRTPSYYSSDLTKILTLWVLSRRRRDSIVPFLPEGGISSCTAGKCVCVGRKPTALLEARQSAVRGGTAVAPGAAMAEAGDGQATQMLTAAERSKQSAKHQWQQTLVRKRAEESNRGEGEKKQDRPVGSELRTTTSLVVFSDDQTNGGGGGHIHDGDGPGLPMVESPVTSIEADVTTVRGGGERVRQRQRLWRSRRRRCYRSAHVGLVSRQLSPFQR